jgi:hypothetical protein
VRTRYHLARPLAVRLLGVGLVLAAVTVMVTTVLVAVSGGSIGVLFGVTGLVVVAVAAAGVWIARGWAVLELDDDGYRLRWGRAVGVRSARWVEVDDALATYAGEQPVVVLQLADGRRTVVPVRLLEVDRDQLVRTLQQHLQRGHGIRRL